MQYKLKKLIVISSSLDLTIAFTTVPGGICAVVTPENIYDKYGYHMLDRPSNVPQSQ